MADYYQILGISTSANSTEIRAAYKKLAMKYHPDHNPDDKEAEDMFKLVNEAYHVLSDPLKKSRYDSRWSTYNVEYSEHYWRELNRIRYQQWKQAQRSRYTFDKEYFRIQGLAFLVFLIISGFCFGLIHATSYYQKMKLEEAHALNVEKVNHVTAIFEKGNYDEAFTMINDLHEKKPLEYYFTYTRDSLVRVVRAKADEKYQAKKFTEAATFYTILKKYERPSRIETLEKLGNCQYQIGDYQNALGSLKQLFALRPWDIEIAFHIGLINSNYFDNQREAHRYYTICKRLFKDNMSNIYGEAFEVVMNPADAPDIYYEIFMAKAVNNIKLENFEEAETDCNWAIFLRPSRAESYKQRAIAKSSHRNYKGLCQDIATAKNLGAEVDYLDRRYCR